MHQHPVLSRLARRLASCALIATVGAQLAGCGGQPAGTALDGGFTANAQGTYASLRPGGEMAIIFVELHNRTHQAVRLASVTPFGGHGLGTVLDVRALTIAPFTPVEQAVPFGAYRTYPPVLANGLTGPCAVQHSFAIRGYQIAPGGAVRVLELVRAVHPGTYEQSGVVAKYNEGTSTRTQRLTSSVSGAVSASAPKLTVKAVERHCLPKANWLPDGP